MCVRARTHVVQTELHSCVNQDFKDKTGFSGTMRKMVLITRTVSHIQDVTHFPSWVPESEQRLPANK